MIKKIIKSLVKTIKLEEKDLKEEEMNVAFFSSRYFMLYLEIYNRIHIFCKYFFCQIGIKIIGKNNIYTNINFNDDNIIFFN